MISGDEALTDHSLYVDFALTTTVEEATKHKWVLEDELSSSE